MDDRGTGLTSRQMLTAPNRAVFVWVTFSSLCYARALARSLGRCDLEIVPPSWLDRQQDPSRPIVVDHAAGLTEQQRARVAATMERFQ